MSRRKRGRGPAPEPRPPVIQLTENELLVTLAALVVALTNFGAPEDETDAESLVETRSAAEKLRLAVGMDMKTFKAFCAYVAPNPSPEMVAFFQKFDQQQRQRTNRSQS